MRRTINFIEHLRQYLDPGLPFHIFYLDKLIQVIVLIDPVHQVVATTRAPKRRNITSLLYLLKATLLRLVVNLIGVVRGKCRLAPLQDLFLKGGGLVCPQVSDSLLAHTVVSELGRGGPYNSAFGAVLETRFLENIVAIPLLVESDQVGFLGVEG